MSEVSINNNKVAFFTGCFVNYYYPEAGKATIEVLHKNRIEVVVPDQVCCGLPMMAKGNYKGAYRNIERNIKILSMAVANGCTLVATCPSCALMIKRDYPLLLKSEKARLVAANMFHLTEYLFLLNEKGELNTSFRHSSQTVFYHTPCHLRAQEIGDVTVKVLQLIAGTNIKAVSHVCCGMGGAYGYEKANHSLSKEIGAKLASEIKANPADRFVTDCGGCKLQMEAIGGVKVDHPSILLREAYNL